MLWSWASSLLASVSGPGSSPRLGAQVSWLADRLETLFQLSLLPWKSGPRLLQMWLGMRDSYTSSSCPDLNLECPAEQALVVPHLTEDSPMRRTFPGLQGTIGREGTA